MFCLGIIQQRREISRCLCQVAFYIHSHCLPLIPGRLFQYPLKGLCYEIVRVIYMFYVIKSDSFFAVLL